MLKGHVFKRQVFGNQIFALFINTFLNGEDGISSNYKNSMKVTASDNSVTIQSGAVCIQGRFLEEDSETTILTDTDNAFCKLVIEINLDNENTDTDFTQASYKIIKGINNYPYSTKNDIVKNNSGIYQYELARFKTSANGISNFQDKRTFLDFDSIYSKIQTEYRTILTQLEQELADVEDASAYVIKSSFEREITELDKQINDGDEALTLKIDTDIDDVNKRITDLYRSMNQHDAELTLKINDINDRITDLDKNMKHHDAESTLKINNINAKITKLEKDIDEINAKIALL